MSNRLPFYLWKRLEGEREHDRFGDVVLAGDINGDGMDEWIIAASTATFVEDEDGVNPIMHYYRGKVYVYSHDLKPLFTLQGDRYGDCFGASVALGDINGDGNPEIIVGAPRAIAGSLLECGTVSVYSGRTGNLLGKWSGEENYARLGAALTVLDWNQDGIPDVAVSSHNLDPNGADRDGRVTVYSGRDHAILESWEGKNGEGLGLSLASGDVDGDGKPELIVSAPLYSGADMTRNGRVLVFRGGSAPMFESRGKRSYDEHGRKVAAFDLDGDGIADLVIGSPKAGGEFTRGGAVTAYNLVSGELVMEKEGWFGLQELGTDIVPFAQRGQEPAVLAGSRVGAAYLLGRDGKLIHEFNGDEAEVFGHSLAVMYGTDEAQIAVGAVSGLNQNRFMSGCVYFLSTEPPAASKRDAPVLPEAAAADSGGALQAHSQPAFPAGDIPAAAAVSPKRILLATYWYLPHVGGVDVYVRLLKKELERKGHQVDVLAHHPDMAHYYLVDGNKKINKWKIKNLVYDQVIRFYQKYLAHVDPWVRYRDVERYCYELAAALFDLDQYDIIHTQDIISTRALSRVKPSRTALVATIHGLLAKEHMIAGDIESKDSLAWKYVADEEYYGCVSANAAILPTEWLRREMVRFSVPPDIFSVIPYGMDFAEFEQRSQAPLTEPLPQAAEFTISCPARLVPVKGHRTLIGALSRISSDPRWHCWLLGDGVLRADVERWISEAGLTDRVTLLGDRRDVPAILRQSDCMVLPSLQDNLPFSIMEAQLSGTPIVASNAGGIPEMIRHEETGLLFETGNDRELAQQLTRLMEDQPLRRSLAKRAKEWANRQWSPDTLLERTLAVYDLAMQRVRT
ncbi:glycosyltransferase [Paenibacillus macerans]|uniref:glycosyltransferase n=1 Tax=Paenibacillus macerans TaxID=44252 RepID=UPI002E1BDB43|nr:glycosyltransferase [Paenibacillus macerans]MED4955250.1 glycosyltransferase [Paenibacillus macerans]